MRHQELLLNAVNKDPLYRRFAARQVLEDFVATLSPEIIRWFAPVPALGGGIHGIEYPSLRIPPSARILADAERAHFEHTPDQTLATHVLNGIFAGFRYSATLDPQAFGWSNDLWRLWILGFTLHDYGKACGVDVPASQLNAVRELCQQLAELLHVERFMPAWQEYRDEIVYLAQNTQTVSRTNLNPLDYQLRSDIGLRQRDALRMLASAVDVLIHARTPRQVVMASSVDRLAQNVADKLRMIPHPNVPAMQFAYHQMGEIRGLLTNLVHRSVQEQFAEQGYQPFLYFTEGIVYLGPADHEAQLSKEQVVETVWQRIMHIMEHRGYGVARDGKGLKIAPPLFELLPLDKILASLVKRALKISNSSAGDRLASLGIRNSALVADIRVDALAEFLAAVHSHLADYYLPQQRSVVIDVFLHSLELDGKITTLEAEQNNGGVPLGWYYVASRYITTHATYSMIEVEHLLNSLSKDILQGFIAAGMVPSTVNPLKLALQDYLERLLGSNAAPHNAAFITGRAGDELHRYTQSKALNRPMCSLCSSTYDNTLQRDTVVLFAPQQFSNKNPLGKSQVVRGICPICTLEMILRKAQGTPGQEDLPVYMTLYPAYSFTPEQASFLQSYLEQLKDESPAIYQGQESLIRFLRRRQGDHKLMMRDLIEAECFSISEEDMEHLQASKRRPVQMPMFRENAFAGYAMVSLTPRGKKTTITDAWILPTLYTLLLPLILNVRVVASQSVIPLYTSADDFVETSVLDGVHGSLRTVLEATTFRIASLPSAARRLLSLYDLHTDVFADGYDGKWSQINAVARDVMTDPLFVFSYLEHKQRKGEDEGKRKRSQGTNGFLSTEERDRYFDIYLNLKGEPHMGLVGTLVDQYATFYQANLRSRSAYGILRPLSLAIDTIVDSSLTLSDEDLVQLVAGQINDVMDRVRRKDAEGFDPIRWNAALGTIPERLALSRAAIQRFAETVVRELFRQECMGDRALLREQGNLYRSAARFYYQSHYTNRPTPPTDDASSSTGEGEA